MPDIIDKLLERVAREAEDRPPPEATYRLQFHAEFTFRDALALVSYLHDLGISHCYASPFLKARPGSTHGYDIVDHGSLNPEIGTDGDFDEWAAALRQHGMGQILDTVPNHMGIGNDNALWNDVLENGPSSPHAEFFDILWYASPRPELQGRVLLPVLGEPYGEALENGRLNLQYDSGAFRIAYFDHRFPIDPRTYDQLLTPLLEELAKVVGAEAAALIEGQSILTAVRHLPARTETEPARIAEGLREKEVVKRRLAALTGEIASLVDQVVTRLNGKVGIRHSFDQLDQLLARQAYRLSFWRVASDEINYRRFFDINDLAALSMERPEVFALVHARILHMLVDGTATGLRIDHPDGLYDPRAYLARLQRHYLLGLARRLAESNDEFRDLSWEKTEEAVGARIDALFASSSHSPLFVVVEKILGAGERLPEDWQTAGTTGYEFLNAINGLFIDGANADSLTRIYEDWLGEPVSFAELAYRNKFLILQTALSSELHMRAYQLDRLAQKDRWSRDFTLNGLRHALREVIACFPVYRSYITAEGVRDADRRHVQHAVWRAKRRNPAQSAALYDFVRDTLLLREPRADTAGPEYPVEQVHFAGKFQQITAPVMAKGVEDTAFYVYNRLLSLNEVGGDPARFGVQPGALHDQLEERQARMPRGLSTTATHDTKRGEDARARLNVLSELPGEWRDAVHVWHRINKPFGIEIEGVTAPSANEEYFLYQTLVGAWPLEPCGAAEYALFIQRVQQYMQKAINEAKVNTSWINPNPAYNEAVREFVGNILDPVRGAEFLRHFRPFQERVSHYGMLNSLAQVLLKLTTPGVPDLYQGTELWDFSLVDPDNRRPVDYLCRRRYLAEMSERLRGGDQKRTDLVKDLLQRPGDGRIKLYVIWQALRCRRAYPGLFTEGDYRRVEAEGVRRDHAFAYQRTHGNQHVLTIVPRLVTRLVPRRPPVALGAAVWGDTRLVLDTTAPRRWRHVFTGQTVTLSGSERATLSLATTMPSFPVALLVGEL